MIKILILIFFCLMLIVSCKNDMPENQQYPIDVISKGLQKQYDSALIAMYRFNSYNDCGCIAVGEVNGHMDTANILELELRLEAILTNVDTTSFVFSYVKLDSLSKATVYTPIGNGNWTVCLFNGIAFKGQSLSAFPTSLGDVKITNIDTSFITKTTLNFYNCLNKSKLSKKLEEYAKNK